MKCEAISYPPRGLSREEAARYIGVGSTLFDEMVADGRMPRPKSINSRAIWDRVALDIAFTRCPTKTAISRLCWSGASGLGKETIANYAPCVYAVGVVE
jgi:predicted DNA-binding transcriptional regulator AlpA